MVENTDDDPVDPKHSFVDYFVEIKPPKVEASMTFVMFLIFESVILVFPKHNNFRGFLK